MTTENRGSNLPQIIENQPKHDSTFHVESLGSGSFTTFFTFRGYGIIKALTFTLPAIQASSRVFVSISEFNSDAQINRIIGDAKMAVYNVAPFNGGFLAWVEISWDEPLNVRFDVLIDP
ncbi:hypothetical protein [Nostoc sp.]|uniref:hypothetical protein n=1 Tax=Nostoc sp. TaxID=1180 RepID=UPI002FFA1767